MKTLSSTNTNPAPIPPQPSFPSHPSSENLSDNTSQHPPTLVTNLTSTVISDTTLAVFTETDTQPLPVPNPAYDPSTDVWYLAVAAQA
jgi:hypothetical protein